MLFQNFNIEISKAVLLFGQKCQQKQTSKKQIDVKETNVKGK